MKYVAGLVVVLALLVFIYAGTSKYVPIRTAIADSITNMSYQKTADQTQLRNQQQQEWMLAQNERELLLSERQQISPTLVTGWQTVIPWIFGVGLLCVIVMMFSTTIGVTNTAIGVSNAAAYRARLVSRQIPLDPETGSYPLLLSEDGNFLIDANNFASMEMKREYAPQLQFVDRSNHIRRLSIIGYSTVNQKKGGADIVIPALGDKFN